MTVKWNNGISKYLNANLGKHPGKLSDLEYFSPIKMFERLPDILDKV
jgi:hypothetical protein